MLDIFWLFDIILLEEITFEGRAFTRRVLQINLYYKPMLLISLLCCEPILYILSLYHTLKTYLLYCMLIINIACLSIM